jgi:hypothetical protein
MITGPRRRLLGCLVVVGFFLKTTAIQMAARGNWLHSDHTTNATSRHKKKSIENAQIQYKKGGHLTNSEGK